MSDTERKPQRLIRADSWRLVRAARFLLERGRTARLKRLFSRLHPADTADILEELDDDSMRSAFDLLEQEAASEVLEEIEDRDLRALADGLSDDVLVSLLGDMATDEAADLIQQLSPERAERVLGLIEPEDQEDLRRLVAFSPETAGAIMDSEFAVVREDALTAEAIEAVREMADELEDIHYVYVVDNAKRLRGVLPLHRLLLTPPGTPVSKIMITDVVTVPPNLDQEDVALLAQRYDLERIPVVDTDGIFLGRITVTDIVDVVSDEVEEDFSRLAGVDDEELHERSVTKISRLRLPWLFVGLIGGLVSAFLMGKFQASLEEVIVLAFFVPVIMNMGGSVGMQSSAIAIRGLATGEIDPGRLMARLWTELRVGFINGLATGGLLALLAGFWQGPSIAIILGTAMLSVNIVATVFGTFVPMLLKKLGFDPALAAGPFITTVNDVVDLLVYLGIATTFLAHWGA
jgi:magnesium transporter